MDFVWIWQRSTVVSGMLTALGVLGGCSDAGENPERVMTRGGGEITFAEVDAALFERATLVVTGTVKKQTVYRSGSDGRIYTLTRFEVQATEKGAHSTEVRVRTPGGRLPTDEFEFVTHEVELRPGEVARLYLQLMDPRTLAVIEAETGAEVDATAVYGVVDGERGKQSPIGSDQALDTGCTPSAGYCVSKWSSGAFMQPLAVQTMPIQVSYDPDNAPLLFGASGAVAMALDAWEDDQSSRVDFHYRGIADSPGWAADGKSTIFWTPLIGNILGSTAVRGVGTQITEFDTGLNTIASIAPFATAPTTGKYLLQEVLIHEIGHGIGLDHIEDANQIMHPTAKQGSNRQTLRWGDRNGVQALYPQGEVPAVGDVNGDGREDIVAFTNNSLGDVWAALSNGSSFGAAQKWSDWIGPTGETPMLGNFNGDAFDDAIAFTQGESKEVWVCLSNGVDRFNGCTRWRTNFAPVGQLPRIGDVNGDGKDDILSFPRASVSSSGSVLVALSNGSSFGAPSNWRSGFPTAGGHTLWVADMNGDFRDDIVSLKDGHEGSADVAVALSTGSAFGPVQFWNTAHNVCGNPNDRAIVGYVDQDHRADIVCIANAPGSVNSAVWYNSGSGFTFGGSLTFGIGSLGRSYFVAKASTFKGSIIEFQHCSFADVNVMRKTSTGHTWAQQTRWHDFFAPRPDPCF